MSLCGLQRGQSHETSLPQKAAAIEVSRLCIADLLVAQILQCLIAGRGTKPRELQPQVYPPSDLTQVGTWLRFFDFCFDINFGEQKGSVDSSALFRTWLVGAWCRFQTIETPKKLFERHAGCLGDERTLRSGVFPASQIQIEVKLGLTFTLCVMKVCDSSK